MLHDAAFERGTSSGLQSPTQRVNGCSTCVISKSSFAHGKGNILTM